ncbi:MAG: cell division protein FtsA [Geminicoccaceae bacterium]
MSDSATLAQRYALVGRPRLTPFGVIDIGNSKVGCVIARKRIDGGFDLIGDAWRYADGLHKGVVVDAVATASAISAALEEAERHAGMRLAEVDVVTSCGAPRVEISEAEAELHGRQVRDHDVHMLLGNARAKARRVDRALLHTLPLEVWVDGERHVREPRGMLAHRLGLRAATVWADAETIRHLIACVGSSHLRVRQVVSAAYASAIACVTGEECENGVIALDLGAGCTGVTLWHQGRLRALASVPVGGRHITGDLCHALEIDRATAERIKVLYGSAFQRACDQGIRVRVALDDGQGDNVQTELSRSALAGYIRPRVEEVMTMAKARLDADGLLAGTSARWGIVLTGGGSQLDGIDAIAHEIFDLPVRFGVPGGLRGSGGDLVESPAFASTAGLLALTAGGDGGLGYRTRGGGDGAHPLFRMRRWLKESF